MNKVHLVGRLAKGPWEFQTASGTKGCVFIMAVSRTVRDKDGNYQADFPKITAWGKTAENCLKYMTQCEFLSVNANIRTYVEEKDGNTAYNMTISAENVSFLGFKQKTPEADGKFPYTEFGDYEENSEDLPF